MYQGKHEYKRRNQRLNRRWLIFVALIIVVAISTTFLYQIMTAKKDEKINSAAGPSNEVETATVAAVDTEEPSESEVFDQTPTSPSGIADTTSPASIVEAVSDTAIEEKEPETVSVTLSGVGDCSLGKLQIHGYDGSFLNYYDKYGESYFFENVKDYFKNDDLTIANLEGVLSNSTERVEKNFNIEGPPEYVGILTDAGIDAVGTANNHIWDYGDGGSEDTWKALDGAEIPYAYYDKTPIITLQNGIKVGIVADCCIWLEQTDRDYVKNGIDYLKSEGADIIVVMLHWGVEGNYYPDAWQVDFAHEVIDWGADLLLGSHPHVLQGMEKYHGKMILYSEGNFCFGGNHNPADKETIIYQQTFTFTDGKLNDDIDAKIIPCHISSTTALNDFKPTPLTGDEAQKLISDMNTYSASLGDAPVHIDSDGEIK